MREKFANYAQRFYRLCGNMRNSLDYAGLAQLCARSPIMRKIMRAHNRIIQPSLLSVAIINSKDAGMVGGRQTPRLMQ